MFLQGGEVRGEAWADVGKWTTGVNEIDHDRLAFEIREAHGVALLIGELKIRHGLADFELLGRRRNGLVGKAGFAHVASPGMVFANPQIEDDAQAGMQALQLSGVLHTKRHDHGAHVVVDGAMRDEHGARGRVYG